MFERKATDEVAFEVSGLLLNENVAMVDDREDESPWPQMQRSVMCRTASGTSLDMAPVLDLTWGHWRSLHPHTKVLPVTVNENSSGASTLKPSPQYVRRNSGSGPSGTVLGLPGTSLGDGPKASDRGAVAVPFQALSAGRGPRAVELSDDDGPVVFWRPEAQAAMAFASSEPFSVTEDGQFVDDKTGSVWVLDGQAIEGPRAGEQLPPVETAYVALWSAWSEFHPNTDVWTGDS